MMMMIPLLKCQNCNGRVQPLSGDTKHVKHWHKKREYTCKANTLMAFILFRSDSGASKITLTPLSFFL